METILDELPATAAELKEKTGLEHEDLYEMLVRLESRGFVRVEVDRHSRKRVWHEAPGL